MSDANVGAGVPVGSIVDTWPLSFFDHNETGTTDSSADQLNVYGGTIIITAIDSIALGPATAAIQCFCTFAHNAHGNFYYDSQTIGEGAGVHFHWRGLLVLQPGEYLHTHMTATSALDRWSVMATGLGGPFPTA